MYIEFRKTFCHYISELMITDLRDITYEDRLRSLHLMTSKTGCIRGDLLETFKIMKGYVDVDYNKFFSLSGGVLRGHSMKRFKPRCRTKFM